MLRSEEVCGRLGISYTTLRDYVGVRGCPLKILRQVRAYPIPIRGSRVGELITWHVDALQKAIDMIWDNIGWGYRFPKLVREGGELKTIMGLRMKAPNMPKDKSFKRMLRDMLMKENPYTSHWVDAVTRTVYSIIESWRRDI